MSKQQWLFLAVVRLWNGEKKNTHKKQHKLFQLSISHWLSEVPVIHKMCTCKRISKVINTLTEKHMYLCMHSRTQTHKHKHTHTHPHTPP